MTETLPAAPSRLSRLTGAPGRLVGLDVARGLAVLGMFVAHLYAPSPTGADPLTWSWVFDGRSSILFATLAGVSLALMSGRTQPTGGVAAVQVRLRILVRAVMVFALGELLTSFGTPVAVILEAYAVLFVLALPFLRWRASHLFVLAAASAVVMPFATPLVAAGLDWAGLGPTMLSDLLVTGTYPGMVWFTFVVLGLAVGRCDLTARDVQLWLAGTGAVVATLAYSTATILTSSGTADDLGGEWVEPVQGAFVVPDLAAVARTAEPHSGGLLEVLGSGAFAVAVVGLCLLVTGPLRWVLAPLAAVGSMALTTYTAHLVVLWRIGDDYWDQVGLGLAVPFVVGALVGCTLWRLLVGRGPLEQLLTWVSWQAARIPGAPAQPAQPARPAEPAQPRSS